MKMRFEVACALCIAAFLFAAAMDEKADAALAARHRAAQKQKAQQPKPALCLDVMGMCRRTTSARWPVR